MKPLCIELFCGTFGWSRGWLEQGGRVIGYDIEHLPHHGPVPEGADLVLQDVKTIDGRRFKDAELILASPPCPEFSYMAMPFGRGRQIARALRGQDEFPKGYKGSRTIEELTALFNHCFRIQREASEAKGEHIPMVVENVRGAQPWVGKARANYGSFYLWGDVPALMPIPHKARKVPGFRFDGSGGSFQSASVALGDGVKAGDRNQGRATGSHEWTTGFDKHEGIEVPTMGAGWYPPGHPKHVKGLGFNTHAEHATKNEGGSWFAIGSPGQKVTGQNPVHDAMKTNGLAQKRDGHSHTRHLTNQAEHDAVKNGGDWFDAATPSEPRRHAHKSSARKAASALIAKIPERLSRWIGQFYFPERAA